jgi:lipid-A-disaccharide synthase-like uncharacterized protein
MNTSIIGVIGALLIALGWIPETLKIIKDKKNKLDWKFALMYFLGSAMLVFYSFQIKDILFILLNSFIMVVEAVALVYSLNKN